MTEFRNKSRSFLKSLAKAAAWMMRRHVGSEHWWQWQVLTKQNPDTDKRRPIFDDETAQAIFGELIERGLLVQRTGPVDASNMPAYTMRYDIEGWDKAVSDGRPFYAFLLKVKRTWILILVTLILGCVLTTIENRVVGFMDGFIDSVTKHKQSSEQVNPADRVQPAASCRPAPGG